MGVISLQGEAQSRLIERKLLERVAPEEIEERRLICGDAYAFQGDERDVIFLSMVAADRDENGQPQRIGTLADESAKQRFNVAASRARDQLWLFHTAARDVLSGKCIRRELLEYMLNPRRRKTEEEEQRFESNFEHDVYRTIVQRGYRVRSQVGVGDTTNHRYRIDLVVEGMQAQLAVECDGDIWHGPERYEQDMARQRDLERAGWQFVHILGSDFDRDPEQAMEPIWAELDRLGISTGGIDKSAAEPPRPASFEVSEGDGSIPTERTETSPGGTESAGSASRDMKTDVQLAKQGVFEFDAGVPFALQPTSSSLDTGDSTRLYETAELEWYEIKRFFETYGCPTVLGTEMGWYEESWGALMRSGLASTSKFEKVEHGVIIIKLRAICLLAMYLGMYQRGGPMEGYFDDHIGLSVYLEELGVDKKTIIEILILDKRSDSKIEEIPGPRIADVREIVGKDYLDELSDLVYDNAEDPDNTSLEELADLVEWEMIEEAVLDLIREENFEIYTILEKHYGRKNLLFVSLWNSRLPLHESEPAIDVLNDVKLTRIGGYFTTGDEMAEEKLMIWSYVEDGMCDWSI